MSDYAGGWFGTTWGAPVCDPAQHLDVPEGSRCIDCVKPIGPDDSGLAVPFVYERGSMTLTYSHLACWLASIQGLRKQLAG